MDDLADVSDRQERFATTADVPLHGDIDLTKLVEAIPAAHTLRGMFFNRYVAALGAEWEELAPTLADPAKHGRYHAFEHYSARDYVRLFDRVARARFPGSTREAYRLLARGEVEVFAESTLGKVTMALLRDPGAALMRYPEVYKMLVLGPHVSCVRRGPRCIAVTYDQHLGSVEQSLGVVEGIVQTFEERPRVDVTVSTRRRIVYEVSW